MNDNKFTNPLITAKGEQRAFVPFDGYQTLWFNTGTQCNLSCQHCYIESSPTNDRLQYLTIEDVLPFLKELKNEESNCQKIGFTGGEPFLNPQMIPILHACLEQGFHCLVLTNAHRVIKRVHDDILRLDRDFPGQLKLRVSLDHYTQELHEKERGAGTFKSTLKATKLLFDQGISLSIAGRSLKEESLQIEQQKYHQLLLEHDIQLPMDNDHLVIFPEMDLKKEVPEISVDCWDILGKTPQMQMCAHERMIVVPKESGQAQVQACTLLAYDPQFNMGQTLEEAKQQVFLNHQFCAQFCVLGGASCSQAG